MIALTTMTAVTETPPVFSPPFTIPVTTPDTAPGELAERLGSLHASGLSWRKIAELPEYKGVPPEKPISPGTLCSIAHGWEPRGFVLRQRLGLPNAASVVPIAGVVPENSQALMAQQCPRCGRYFISNHPRRIKCFLCSPYRKARKL
jgi:ribosomal protein S27AE